MSIGVLLYGPPAAGKDTVTEALLALDPRLQRFERMKVGTGKTHGYRMVPRAEVDALDRRGEVIWANERYGSTYVIDRPHLIAQLAHAVPIVHVGQPEALAALQEQTPTTRWITVNLWCPRDEAARRIASRGNPDHAERMKVWDNTPTLPPPASILNTDEYRPLAVARLIYDAIRAAT